MRRVEGPWWVLCQLKKLFKGPRLRRGSCWEEQKKIMFPRWGVDLHCRQIDDGKKWFFYKKEKEKNWVSGLGRMQGFNGMGGRPGAAVGQLYNHKNGAQQKNKNRGGKKNKKVSNIFRRCIRINFLMHWECKWVLPFPVKIYPFEIFTRATPGSSLVYYLIWES